jgi:hypothetical protein
MSTLAIVVLVLAVVVIAIPVLERRSARGVKTRVTGPIKAVTDRKSRRALLEAVRNSAAAKAAPGPSAARSQDFLYGDDGLPR